jgi:cobaltochelatase CobS
MSNSNDMVFDPDVLKAIRANAGSASESPASAPVKQQQLPSKLALPDGWQYFSALFWQPTSIPDVPVPVFSDDDWHESVRPYVPSEDVLTYYRWPKREAEQAMLALYCEDRCLLHGPTGTGKTELPRAICAKLRIPFIRINGHRRQDSTDFLGKDIIDVDPATNLNVVRYDWPLFALAYKYGGMILVDEAFRSPVLMAIQSCFEKGGELILPDAAGLTTTERRIKQPPKAGWLWLTDNTNGTGDSTGAYVSEVQDLSTLDRITATIYVDYLDSITEADMLAGRYATLTKTAIVDMVSFANQVRTAFKGGQMLQTFSVRALMSWAEKAVLYGNLKDSLIVSWANKLGSDDRALACNIYAQVFSEDLPV